MAETDFGIAEYVGGKIEPIDCILKQMYTDFIVQEIGDQKQVLPIKSTGAEPKPVEIKTSTAKEIEEDEEIPEYLPEKVIEQLRKFDEKLPTIPTETFSIDAENLSKEDRTSVHKYVRKRYGGRFDSELRNNKIELKIASNNRNNRKRKQWGEDIPDYLHFTLAKENKDTLYALGIIGKFSGLNQSLFRTCGIKDKRAVTSQRVSCYRVEKDRIQKLNPRLRDITVFDFEYKAEGLKMGGHWGNRFSIILREIASEENLSKRCEIFKKEGFINYYGTQRFGSMIGNTAETGKLIVQRKWEDAIKNVMKTARELGNSTVGEAAAHFLETGDAAEAVKKLKGGQAFASNESAILRALANEKTWQQCFTEALPVSMRSLYVHAYQSLIWNKLVTKRIQEFGSEPKIGDVDKDGKILSDHEINDVFMPLPGSPLEKFPDYAKVWLEELLKEDSLTNDSFFGLRDRFALGDSTRQVIVIPGEVNYEFIRYRDRLQILQEGLKDEPVNEKNEESSEAYLALKIQFSLPNGSYATVALRQVTGVDMGKNNMAKIGRATLGSTVGENLTPENQS